MPPSSLAPLTCKIPTNPINLYSSRSNQKVNFTFLKCHESEEESKDFSEEKEKSVLNSNNKESSFTNTNRYNIKSFSPGEGGIRKMPMLDAKLISRKVNN